MVVGQWTYPSVAIRRDEPDDRRRIATPGTPHDVDSQTQDFSSAAQTAAPVDVAEGERWSPERLRLRMRLVGLIGVPVLAVIAGLWFWLSGGRYQSTDNAYFQSGLTMVSPAINGRVIAVEVRENQHVRTGQVLFRIDPTPFAAAVAADEAALADARAQVTAQRATYGQGQADIAAAQAQLDYASGEAARQKQLLAEGISSKAQYDQALLAVQNARAGIASSQKKNEAVLAGLAGHNAGSIDAEPVVQRAVAALAAARYELANTTVLAAQDGIVTHVVQLQPGDFVTAGKPVFALAGNHIWVEANFKENQLDHMRVGQHASLQVDAFPSLRLTGHVASFSPGTGSAFALLPPENATGNWVKVVQRLPVELEIDNVPADVPLHAGLSVDVSVDTGYRRHLFGQGTAGAQ